jgi:hypothetical protein
MTRVIGKISGGVGSYSAVRRRGGGKKPLTLRDLRARDLTPLEASDMGACGCFLGAAA